MANFHLKQHYGQMGQDPNKSGEVNTTTIYNGDSQENSIDEDSEELNPSSRSGSRRHSSSSSYVSSSSSHSGSNSSSSSRSASSSSDSEENAQINALQKMLQPAMQMARAVSQREPSPKDKQKTRLPHKKLRHSVLGT